MGTTERRSFRWAILGSLAGLGLLVLVWKPWSPPVRTAAPGGPAAAGSQPSSVSGKQADPASDAGPPRRGPVPESRTAPGTLELSVLGGDDQLVPGVVLWTFSPRPILTSRLLAPDLGFAAGADGPIQHMACDGSARIEVPAESWTWLRVTSAKKPGSDAYERIPPFTGVVRKEVRLSETAKGLHVFVLRPDLRTPAGGAEVSVYTRDMRSGGPPKPLRTERTDSFGYLCLRPLAPGALLVCAPGASPEDGPPHMAHVMLAPGMPPTELACTLVVPEARVEVRLEILADFEDTPERRQGIGRALFLKRVDDGSGRLTPVPGAITTGKRTARVLLSPGEYEAGVVPQGDLQVVPGMETIRVSAHKEQACEVWLADNVEETELALRARPDGRGGSFVYPLVVYWRKAERVVEDRTQLLFCGPFHWQTATQRVRSLPEGGYLIAAARDGPWISSRDVRVRGPRSEVEMSPACRVVVHWLTEDLGSGGPPVVTIVSGSVVQSLPLSRELVQDQGAAEPAYRGEIIVPRGRASIECRTVAGGVVWSREVVAERQMLQVRVGT